MKSAIKCLSAAVAAAVVVLSGAHAAFALSATASGTNYSGACPTNVRFDGTITGTPSTQVSYYFFYWDPQTSSVKQRPSQNTTIPGAGSISVSDSAPFSAAQAGNSWVQMYVRASGGGVVYSNKASFSVTCTSVAPPTSAPGGPAGGGNAPHNMIFPAPNGLARSNNAQDCGTHGASTGLFGGALCGNYVLSGKPVLIWNWSPVSFCPLAFRAPFPVCPSDIDGYRIYKTNMGSIYTTLYSHGLVDTMSLGRNVTLSMSSKLREGDCYVVRAFKGDLESQNSNELCMGGGRLVNKTAYINPGYWRSYHDRRYHEGTAMITEGRFSCESSIGCVGHQYSNATGLVDSYDNEVWRLGVWFDIGSLSATTIYSAYLKFAAYHQFHSNPDNLCLRYITRGSTQWWGAVSGSLVKPDPSTWDSVGPLHGALQAINVTTVVRQWLTSRNYGFILSGDENLGAFADETCIDNYEKIWLEVTYQ
jgi:hypothetical protein